MIYLYIFVFLEHSRIHVGWREGEYRTEEIHDVSFPWHQEHVQNTWMQPSDGSLYFGGESGCTCYCVKRMGGLDTLVTIVTDTKYWFIGFIYWLSPTKCNSSYQLIVYQIPCYSKQSNHWVFRLISDGYFGF